MDLTNRSTEAGCKPDQAADQARTDNGSQETVRKDRTRAKIARLSPIGRVLLVAVQCRRGIAGMGECLGPPAAARGPGLHLGIRR